MYVFARLLHVSKDNAQFFDRYELNFPIWMKVSIGSRDISLGRFVNTLTATRILWCSRNSNKLRYNVSTTPWRLIFPKHYIVFAYFFFWQCHYGGCRWYSYIFCELITRVVHPITMIISIQFLTILKMYTQVAKHSIQIYIFQRSEKYLNTQSFVMNSMKSF